MQPPVLALQNVALTFGGNPLFTDLSLNLGLGEKVSLIGRNGCGKSTLLKLLSGLIDYDQGTRFCQPGLKISYLPQDANIPAHMTAQDYVCTSGCEAFEADAMLGFLGMNPSHPLQTLSGGEARRISLAKALVGSPDVLLLDEPTNHLDLPTIEWLEDYLKSYRGAVMFISHDRSFLRKVSSSMMWLDRGTLLTYPKGFTYFEEWEAEKELNEQKYMERLNTRLKQENQWMQTGVTARRKRNQGRLRDLLALRAEKKEVLSAQHRSAQLPPLDAGQGSKLVVELKDVSLAFGSKSIIKNFTTRIMRGDRIGIIGPNGAGKTSLIKMMVGQLQPDSGSVKQGKSIELVYFDQMRDQLALNKSLWQNLCPQGGDQVIVQGEPRNVMGYLKEFLFNDKQIHGVASILSGGEKNRLALAIALARPSNVLVLDEPTNDLDMDTLDLLIDLLSSYKGTLLIVSHDRDFLDKLTTSIFACEGNGKIQEYVGGYTDYINYKNAHMLPKATAEKPKATQKSIEPEKGEKAAPKKLSYNLKRELDMLPQKIEDLTKSISHIENELHNPNLYDQNPSLFQKLSNDLISQKAALEEAESRWLELEVMAEAAASGGNS